MNQKPSEIPGADEVLRDLGIDPATAKSAAKWTLAGILVPIGAGLLVTAGVVFVVVHFLAKLW